MLKLLLITLVVVAIAFLCLGINIVFFKKPFPETEISRNKEMYKRGIRCAKCEEMRKHRRKQNLAHATLDVEKLGLK